MAAQSFEKLIKSFFCIIFKAFSNSSEKIDLNPIKTSLSLKFFILNLNSMLENGHQTKYFLQLRAHI